MSVLLEFAMFPTDKSGTSASKYVSKIIRMIKESGVSYKLTSMGTIIETNSLQEALNIVNDSYKILEKDANRVYSTISIDIKKEGKNRMIQKIDSIEAKIGSVKK